MDPLFPFIQIPPPASHGASATAAFYKALETGAQHSGRRVKIDYSQSAIPHDKGRGGRFQSSNDGTRDIGNSQSPILLFRGLDPLSGPQAISQAMKTSSGIGKEGAKGMKRIILIKDKVTLGSWGFAFVEFVDQQVMPSFPSCWGIIYSAFLVCISHTCRDNGATDSPERVPYFRQTGGSVFRSPILIPTYTRLLSQGRFVYPFFDDSWWFGRCICEILGRGFDDCYD